MKLLRVGYGLVVAGLVVAEMSYPLLFSSYREVPSVHGDIDRLRKARNGGVTAVDDVYGVVARTYATCPADTYLLINQPGVRVEDFQTLRHPEYGITLWESLKEYLGRVGTLGSFPRLDAPLDLDRLEHMLKRQCSAVVIEADETAEGDLFERYQDTAPRVIRLNLPPLPEEEPHRTVALKRHDELVFEAFKLTPSPFFALVYTSDVGEPFVPDADAFHRAKHWDIFADLVRLKRDPRNRGAYKKDERHTRSVNNEPISRVPPLAEKKRRDEKRAWKQRAQKTEELYLSKETVGTLIVVSVGLGLVYAVFRSVQAMGNYLTAADMSKTPSKLEETKKTK
ncbi:hypothetical protein TRICI_006776 [Trichomonascus ciferrii]|uniref:Protein BIG1 n=1 Tax=Trichomonascus ciferrii TaxID=44093 RepID=A0A642UDB8_9ASCO|nr:hypothetical protein TRICI_006776 [Trichomonascus ciferrii]